MVKQETLERFIQYWAAANAVDFDEIKTLEDAENAIRFCSVLRVGAMVWLKPEQFYNTVIQMKLEGKI